MSLAMLNINELSVNVADRQLLQQVSIQLPNGCFAALVGPNGGGKTTFLKSLAGLVPISNGSISYPFQEKRPDLVTYLPAKSHLNEDFTTFDVIQWGKPYRYMYDSAFDQILKELWLLDVLEKPVVRLSDGEQKRVHLARVLYQLFPFDSPKLLLLDEPLAPLDPKYQLSVLRFLNSLSGQFELTIILSLHQPQMIRLFQHVIALKKGSLFYSGSTNGIQLKPVLTELYDVGEDEIQLLGLI